MNTKKLISRLKTNQKVDIPWSTKEKKLLKELKLNGVYPSTIFKDKETMNRYFKKRTYIALQGAYQRIGND